MMKTVSGAENSKKIIDIDAPGLFLFGDLDDFLILDHMTVVKKYVKNIQVRAVKGANHFVQQDDPDTVNKYIREFLGSSQ
jgi:pimeloyl-ACP methyl ester carboxylesterase